MFIACSIEADYSVLGTGTPEQLYAAWLKITSEYYTAIGDEDASRYVTIIIGMEAIRFRGQYIEFMIAAMEQQYNLTIAATMQHEYRLQGLLFTPESYAADLKHVRSIEKHQEIKYEALQAEYDAMEQGKKGTTATRINYIEYMLDINKHEGAQYSEDMSMEIYCLCLARLKAHYKQLKEAQKA